MFAGQLALTIAALFAGAAIYINLVEHPARLSCGTEIAAKQWASSYKRATAYVGWSAETPTARVPVGTDTFVIRGGRIVIHTFAAHFVPKQ